MVESSLATAGAVLSELEALADPKRAESSAWYFKAGPGEYGAGDRFLGVRVPQTRVVANRFRYLEPGELFELAHSPWHEARLCALLILVAQFRRAKKDSERAEAFAHYLRLLDDGVVNNWDLIDSSAPYLGQWLINRPEAATLRASLAQSPSLWKRRAAIMFTAANIRALDFAPTIEIANLLLHDAHDLIQKAVGWMLREIGNRDVTVLRAFLSAHASHMPRTILRYSIEKLEPAERSEWMAQKSRAVKPI